MEKIQIYCTDTEQSKDAEILSINDKYVKVALSGTTMTLELFRTDVNRPYVGNKAGLEFKYVTDRKD